MQVQVAKVARGSPKDAETLPMHARCAGVSFEFIRKTGFDQGHVPFVENAVCFVWVGNSPDQCVASDASKVDNASACAMETSQTESAFNRQKWRLVEWRPSFRALSDKCKRENVRSGMPPQKQAEAFVPEIVSQFPSPLNQRKECQELGSCRVFTK